MLLTRNDDSEYEVWEGLFSIAFWVFIAGVFLHIVHQLSWLGLGELFGAFATAELLGSIVGLRIRRLSSQPTINYLYVGKHVVKLAPTTPAPRTSTLFDPS
jgi:hypothetical protein